MNKYSQHELDAKIHTFMKKKMHQFPELRNERHYVERIEHDELIKPVEQDRVKRSQLFPSMRLSSQY